MVWLLRTLVVGIFVAVLAFTAGAIALQQGGPGTTPAAIGSILLIAAVPLGLITFIVLSVRAFIARKNRPHRRAAAPAGRPAARPRR